MGTNSGVGLCAAWPKSLTMEGQSARLSSMTPILSCRCV